MGGATDVTTDLGSYKYDDKGIKGNEFRNGTLNVTGNQAFADGTFTFGQGLTINQEEGQWGISGGRTVKFINGAKLNYTSTSDIYFGRLADGTSYNGTSQFILDGGVVDASASLYFSPKATSGNKDKNVVLNFIMLNNSSLTLLTDKELLFGQVSRDSSYKHKTLKVTAAITNSTITAKQVRIGQTSSYVSDEASSFNKITFGPGTVLNVGQVYSYAYPAPTVVFDGAKICWNADAGDSIIGQNDGVKTSIYAIGPKGLVIDKQSGFKRVEVSNYATVLSGDGGITKTGPGDITWDKGNIGGSRSNPMTFTGPLVVSNGTWTSKLGYAASAFRADGGTLVLSGELSAENVAFAATEAGTLTLADAEITDVSPDFELAGGGKTDYFTRDGAVSTYTFDSLTLGEGAVLDLDGNAAAIDAINATTTTITATSDNPATININFSAAPAADTVFTFFEADNADKFTVNPKLGSLTIPHEVSVKNGMLTLTITAEDYTWNDSQTNWGDAGAWDKGKWSDGNNAIFSTANATANLAANAAASEVRFRANATISGSATLTAGKVDVAEDVAATISTPTSGSLEKTGEGTLTLGASRTEQTTLSEGTLAMANGATVNPANLTLGTDAAKPVVFDYGGQRLAFNPESNILAHMDVALANGEFTNSGTTFIEDSTMRVAGDASFVGAGWICVGGKSSSDTSSSISACLVVDGGAVTNRAYHLSIGDYGAFGSLSKVLVTNGGEYYSANHVSVAQGSTGYLIVDASRVTAISGLRFCNEERCVEGENGYVSVTNGGEIVTTAVKYGSGAGNGYFDFDGGTLKARADGTLIYEHDRLFVSVNDEGGTIDNGGFSVTIAEDLLGAGAVTNKGAGSITYSVNQTGTGEMVCEARETFLNAGLTVERPTTVASGAMLTVNATSQAIINRLTLDAGSTLNIASYAGTAAALSVSTLTLPDSGTVSLTLNGGAFPVGTYKILDMGGIADAAVDGKLVPLTVSETTGVYSIDGSTLVLTVGTPVHGRWIGANGGNFADPGSWSDGQVPVKGEALDFSGVTANMTINCGNMSGTKFGAVEMGTGVITFTGSFMAASFSDTSKIAVGANSTVTLDGNLTFSGSSTYYLTYKVDEGGAFVVTGTITASESADVRPYSRSSSGYIVAKGLVNSEKDGWNFRLNNDNPAKWVVGENGFSGGSAGFWSFNNSNAETTIKADADFDIDTWLSTGTYNGKGMSIDTAGWTDPEASYTITVNNCIIGVKPLTVLGGGKFVCNYTPQKANGQNYPYSGAITVANTATLAINPGKYPTTGAITLNEGTTLEVAQSGTVALGGALNLKAGAALAFNYTNRGNPVLDLTEKTVTFDEGETTNVLVKITADEGKRGFSGKMVLTSSGGKFAGVTVTLDQDAPDWVKGIDVVNGEIVLDVKPVGTRIIVR